MMNNRIHTLADKIEAQLNITEILFKELQSEIILAEEQEETDGL